MKFLCLGYHNEAAFDALPEEKRETLLKSCFVQCVPFRATGKVVEEEGLHATNTAKTIRPRNGRPTITDGPFLAAKEQIGAFFIIDAETIVEAIAVASLHPGALLGEEYGFGIEVRPI